MIEIKETELVVAFPDVDEEAILRVHFCPADVPEKRITIKASPAGGIRLETAGRFVMHLCPEHVHRERLPREVRYPFAILLSVGGVNAITGEIATALIRTPQNFFTTPPQGVIDGFYRAGHVHPFRAEGDTDARQVPLEIKVLPIKIKAFAYLKHQLRLIPGWGASALRGITLLHGGERQCEPIYEDICGIGSWDTDHEEQIFVCVSGIS